MDVASLGLSLDPTPIDRGVLSLEKFAASAKKTEKSASDLGRSASQAAGMTGALGAALEDIGQHRNPFKPHLEANDNFRSALGDTRREVDRFHSALERIREFTWNNTGLSGNDIDRIINPIQGLGAAIGGLPTIAIAAAAGVEVALTAIGASAQRALADLQDVSSRSGLGVNQIAGAQIIGARAGLSQDQSRSALESAANEFDAYRRNSGSVKDSLEQIDEGFLKVADKARSAGEFIDLVEQKIRALPREEGLDLSKALLGDDAGARLFESIRNGAFSMGALGDAAARAGGLNEDLARKALNVQHQIDEAAEVARTKLLVAFQDLGNPVDNIKLGWWGVVGSIGDAISRSEEFRQVLQGLMHPIDTLRNAPNVIGRLFEQQQAQPIGRLIDMNATNDFDRMKSDFFARGPRLVQVTAGASRARYAARDEEDSTKSSGGGRSALSDAQRSAEAYQRITHELDQQKSLLVSTGAEHDKIALQIETERRLTQLGAGATAEQKDRVTELVAELDRAKKAQDTLNESAKAFNSAYGAATNSLSGAFKDILHGGRPADALQKALTTTQDQLFDAALTGSGPFAKMFGLSGKDGAVGGLFGGIADAFGLGPKSVGAMNVQATNVNINGGLGGLLGGGNSGGGLLGNLFGGGSNFAGQPAGAMGPFQQGGGFLGDLISGIGSIFGFADGGVMTSRGPLPLRRYADGGIANSPQLAMFGEGAGPEAFVPLKNGGIPVNLNRPSETPVMPNAQSLAYARSLAAASNNNRGGTVAAPMTVNIHNAPAGAKVEESTDAKGGRRVDVILADIWANAAVSPQGQQIMRQFYGRSRPLGFR